MSDDARDRYPLIFVVVIGFAVVVLVAALCVAAMFVNAHH